MDDTPLMQRGQQKAQDEKTGDNFTPQDAREHSPPELHDDIDKVVAAGVRMMYSPALADEREAAISSPEPMPKLLGDNVTGLMLMLDQKSKGGIPQAVIFPAATNLLNEVANLVVEAGKKVTQDDYNSALQILYVQLGKKLGATDDQLMKGAEMALQKNGGGDGAPDDENAEAAPDSEGAEGEPDPGVPPADQAAAPPGAPPPDDEENL